MIIAMLIFFIWILRRNISKRRAEAARAKDRPVRRPVPAAKCVSRRRLIIRGFGNAPLLGNA